jgi:ABC-type multidrug transport system fused ATPase/permease subunit
MIVPTYWAEARLQEKTPERQVTVRRFGWSDASQADAQAKADARARDALTRIWAGEKLHRRDLKVPYNGAEGVPIREEIVERAGEMVVTRNSYGARCLNVPEVLFADIDLARAVKWQFGCGLILAAGAAALWLARGWARPGRLALVIAAAIGMAMAVTMFNDWWQKFQMRRPARVPPRLKAFVARNPEWHLRLYRTPAGFRVLAMHRTFAPREPAVAEAFRAWQVDPLYAVMCWNQQCFRARLSAKPWRIGIAQHMRPRPGVWPVKPERLPERARWVADYEEAARGFAACRFVEAIGSSDVTVETESVRAAHDRWCAAESDLPLA